MTYKDELVEIPLFPLPAVLFPSSKMRLQIFEKRYLDLVSTCLRDDTGFGVILHKDYQEVARVGLLQGIYDVGTFGKIIDWNPQSNGLLGVAIRGTKKFKVEDSWLGEDKVMRARVRFCDLDFIANEGVPEVDDESGMTALLQLLQQHPAAQADEIQIDYRTIWELGWRLCELIPVALLIKQMLLELNDPWERVKLMDKAIGHLADDYCIKNPWEL